MNKQTTFFSSGTSAITKSPPSLSNSTMIKPTQLKNKTLIIMDERERGTIRKTFLEHISNFSTLYEAQIDTLPIADYIISPEWAIERKRGDDLTSSICDSRFFTQLMILKQVFPHAILVLEKPHLSFSRKNMFEGSILGAIMYVSHKLGISIIPTKDEAHTTRFITRLATTLQKKYKNPLTREFTQELKTKVETLEKEQKEGPISKEEIISFIEGLYKTGKKGASDLLMHFSTAQQVINAISKSKLTYTKTGNMKGVEGPLNGKKGFGPKYLLRNKRLLELPFNITGNLPAAFIDKN